MFDREAYFCSEGKPHYNEDYMWSYYPTAPKSPYLTSGPTFINVVEKIDEKGLENYITSVVNSKVNIITGEISSLVYNKLKNDVSLSVEEAVHLTFAELGIISEEDIDTITQN